MEILRSKRFVSAVIGIVVLILSNVSPEIGRLFGDIQEPVAQIILLLIGGYAVEDAIQAWKKPA